MDTRPWDDLQATKSFVLEKIEPLSFLPCSCRWELGSINCSDEASEDKLPNEGVKKILDALLVECLEETMERRKRLHGVYELYDVQFLV